MGGLGLHALMTNCYSLFRMPMLPTTCCATTLCAQALLYALIQHKAKPDVLFSSKPCPIAHVLFLCCIRMQYFNWFKVFSSSFSHDIDLMNSILSHQIFGGCL